MNTTIAAARATTTTSKTEPTWAVLDRGDRVVVLFAGDEAEAEARSWRARGYRVTPLAD